MSSRILQYAGLSLILVLAAVAFTGCTDGEGSSGGGSGGGGNPAPLAINTSVLPGGVVGQAYSQLVAASGGTGTGYSWAVTSGALPVGVNLTDGTPSASLAGTPGVAANYTFTLQVTDDGLNVASVNLAINVTATAPGLAITTNSLPNGALGVAYGATVAASGGTGSGYTWSVLSGALPAGVSLTSGTPEASLSGAPTGTGTANFTLQVTDSGSNTVTRGFSITVGTVPLVITTTTIPQAAVGHSYSATIETAGGSGSGYTWSVTAGTLPNGLGLTGNGRTADITGTPTALTSSTLVTFTVQDPSSSQSASVALYMTVMGPVQISNTTVPGAPLNQAYVATIGTIYGSQTNYQWSLIAGTLPPGLTLNGTTPHATITGTATAAGSYPFTLQVDDSGTIDTQAFTLVVATQLVITTSSLPDADSGVPYSQTITASGGSGTYFWSGGFPAGLTLSSGTPSATVSGTTQAAGSYLVSVFVQDSNSMLATATFSLTVNPGSFVITTTSLADATVGAAYNQTIQTTGGTPTAFVVVSGALPAGLTVSATGVISGVPSMTGSLNFEVQATASGGASHRAVLGIDVLPANTPLTVTTSSLPPATEGAGYMTWLTAYGGTNTGYSWAVASGVLPAGVSIAGDLLSGTPTEDGSFSVTLEVTDSGANTAQATLSLLVHPALTALAITTTSLPDGIDGESYNEAISAQGGTAPYNWSVSAGNLPSGTVLTGGTPTAAVSGVAAQGNYTFVLQVQDAAGMTATQSFGVVVSTNTPLVIDTDYLPSPLLGAAYTSSITATGGTGSGYTWSSLGGDLPFGLTLSSGTSATLSGTPTVPGAYRFAVRVSDSAGAACTVVYTVTVQVTQPLRVLAPELLPPAVAGQAWSLQLRAEGGTGTGYNWAAPTLPSGLTLTPNGATATLSSATLPATVPYFSVNLTDSGTGATAYPVYVLVTAAGDSPRVSAPLTTGEMPGGMVGKAWQIELGVTNGSGAGYAWSVASGALPPGIAMHARGANLVLEGVPLVPGDWYFSLVVVDGAGKAGLGSYHFTASLTRSFFAHGLGAECLFVLDRSGSMYGARHRNVRLEVENTVLQMDPGQSLDLVTFESLVRTMWGQLKPATPANRAEALAFANGTGLLPAGGTSTYPAMQFATSNYPTSVDSMFLVTDGYPSGGGSATQLLADFPGWLAPFSSCEFVGVGIGLAGSGATFLQQLTQSVGGVLIWR